MLCSWNVAATYHQFNVTLKAKPLSHLFFILFQKKLKAYEKIDVML
jgi:hypothetical protein